MNVWVSHVCTEPADATNNVQICRQEVPCFFDQTFYVWSGASCGSDATAYVSLQLASRAIL